MAQIAVARADTSSEVIARALLLENFPLSIRVCGSGPKAHYLIFVDKSQYYSALHVLKVAGIRTDL